MKPDLLVKGGTYAPHEIVGRELVEAYGGQVKALGKVPGISTTLVLEQLRGIEGSLIGRRDENRPLSSELDRRRRDGDAGLAGAAEEIRSEPKWSAVLRPYVADVLAGLDLVDRSIVHDPHGPRPRRARLAIRPPTETGAVRPGRPVYQLAAQRRGSPGGPGPSAASALPATAAEFCSPTRLTPKSRSVPNPVLDEYLRLAGHLGCDIPNRQTEAAVLPHDEQELARFWKQYDPRFAADGVVCLNPGGAFGSSKHWPTENFADLARRIVDQSGPHGARAVRTGRAGRSAADRAAGRAANGSSASPIFPRASA